MDVTWASEWLEDYADAWRRGDPEVVAELFTEGAVYRSSPLREPAIGRVAISEYWRQSTSTQKDLDLRFGQPVVHGNRVVVEWWALMRDDGSEVTLPGCLLLRFASGGRCEELREYWHLEQGRHEPPEGWGT
jgi:nuclear transport factor 2 (NTF2) superfamily protein